MKNILSLVLVLIFSVSFSQDKRIGMADNNALNYTEFYIKNSPTSTVGNRTVVELLRGMELHDFKQDTIRFKTLSGVGERLVISDAKGNIKNKPISDFYLSSNPNGYISSYTETDPLFDTKFATKSTTDLTEGSKLFYTESRARNSISAGAGISYNNSTGVISRAKRQETYSGTTNASGVYTVTFATAYPIAPNIQANIIGATDSQNIRITAISTTGFTVTVRNRVDVIGLLPTWVNVTGASVDVLITEK